MRTSLKLRTNPDRHGKHILYVTYIHQSQFHPFSTGIKIEKKYFNEHEKDICVECPEYSSVMRLIMQTKEKIELCVKKCFNSDLAPTTDNVKNLYNNSANVNETSPDHGYDIIEEYIKYKNSKEVSGMALVANLKKSIKKKCKDEFILEDITAIWIDDFINGVISGRYSVSGKKLTNTTINMYIMAISSILKWAKGKGYAVPDNYQNYVKSDYKVVPRQRQILTKEEISAILSYEPKVNIDVMEAFRFCLTTSIRFSDARSLRWEHVDMEERLFTKIAIKNKTRITLALNDEAYKVLERREDRNGLVFDLPTINSGADRKLKEHFREMGMTRKVVIGRMSKRTYIEEQKELWEVINTHTARHNYGYIFLDKTQDVVGLKEIYGHKNISTTMRYAKINQSKLLNTQRSMFS